MAAGIGPGPARAAARAVVEGTRPDLLISVGWAGSLRPEIQGGALVVPEVVMEATDRRAFRTFCGTGTLVTVPVFVHPPDKVRLAAEFSARAIDMEAATVAEVAQETSTRFLAIKAIFDEPDFAMPPVGRFCSRQGGFQYGRFLVYMALRPALWGTIPVMRRKALQSAARLSEFLEIVVASDSLAEIQQHVARLSLGVPLES